MKKTQGFSLLEVLVSASIIAILTVIGVVSYSSVNKRSRDVKRKSDLEQIRSALEFYRTDFSAYPMGGGTGNFVDMNTLATDLVNNNYMPAIPLDSSGSVYYYQAIETTLGVYGSYCLCGHLESLEATQSTCSVPLHADCNYGLKNP